MLLPVLTFGVLTAVFRIQANQLALLITKICQVAVLTQPKLTQLRMFARQLTTPPTAEALTKSVQLLTPVEQQFPLHQLPQFMHLAPEVRKL